MKPVYCVRLEGSSWKAAQKSQVRGIVEDWIEKEHPFDDRGSGVSIRLDAEDPGSWWRYTIDVSHPSGALVATTITLSCSDKISVFEVRTSLIPGGVRVTPLKVDVSLLSKRLLVKEIIDSMVFLDAGVRLRSQCALIANIEGAQMVAAFFEAPSRSLPIIIETMSSPETSIFELNKIESQFAGLAHTMRLSGTTAVAAFNDFHGADVLQPQGLTILWPDHSNFAISGRGLLPASNMKDCERVRGIVTEIAADSLAPLRAPRFKRRVPEPVVDTPVAVEHSVIDVSSDPEFVGWGEYRLALDGWQEAEEKIGELEQAMTEADRLIDEKQQLLENRDLVVDQLVLQNTEFAIRLGKSPTGLKATSAIDAVEQAKMICENLVFHDLALQSAKDLHGIDANRLLQDLVRLNVVAGDWQSGRINNSSLTISCRSFGLNYAAGVGEVAEEKYGEDYSFSWRGRTEYAVAHIRNGRGVHLYRVHLYFDNDSHQVVVAYVGRHLRGKRDHN